MERNQYLQKLFHGDRDEKRGKCLIFEIRVQLKQTENSFYCFLTASSRQ